MAISENNVREEFIGTGSLDTYTFDFKIRSLDELNVIVTDEDGIVTFDVDGNDSTYLSSVTFDDEVGGGTVVLVDDLPTDHNLILLYANDAPLQESEFKSKRDFTLSQFEVALDKIVAPLQRLAYLMTRSLRIPDKVLDTVGFDGELPTLVANYIVGINEDADGFELKEPTEIIAATAATEFAITDGQSATSLTDETADGDTYSSVVYEFEIIRGTTVVATGDFSLHYKNSTWEIVLGGSRGDDHGVTFSVTQATTIAQLQAALDSGAGNGTIKLKKHRFLA